MCQSIFTFRNKVSLIHSTCTHSSGEALIFRAKQCFSKGDELLVFYGEAYVTELQSKGVVF